MTTESNVSWREQVLKVLRIKALQDQLNINYIQPKLLLPKVSDIEMIWFLFQSLCEDDEKNSYQLCLNSDGSGYLSSWKGKTKIVSLQNVSREAHWTNIKDGIDKFMEILELV